LVYSKVGISIDRFIEDVERILSLFSFAYHWYCLITATFLSLSFVVKYYDANLKRGQPPWCLWN